MRRRFLAKLAIPTYCQMKKIMFYDTLQCLCDKKNLLTFNQEMIQKDKVKIETLRKLGVMVQDDLAMIMDQKTELDFAKTIRNMGRLNPKAKMMKELQRQFCRVNETALYVDTVSNFHLTDKERR